MFQNRLTERLAAFVRGIGIEAVPASLPDSTFLPGLDVRYGVLLIDDARLAYPGDILHEAGHVAVCDPAERKQEKLTPNLGDEIAAIAWSYAALRFLDLNPAVVFHEGGYQRGSRPFIENISTGRYVGVLLLQLYGLAVEPRLAEAHGLEAYPHMLGWVR